jgi:hypothetical protein
LSRLPLVLAIEPDLRQAAIVKRVVKERVQAEIVVVDSRDAAIAAIRTAIPDVLLVSALLSPRDEDDLMAHLRALEGATHLQTHTIPQLASTLGGDNGGRGGLLSAFRRKKAESTPAGCDPDLFADEIRMFVKRAEEKKREAAEAGTVTSVRPRIQRPVEAPAAAPKEESAPVAGSSWASPFEWRPSNASSYVPGPEPPSESAPPALSEPSIANPESSLVIPELPAHEQVGAGIGDLESGIGDLGPEIADLGSEIGELGPGIGDLGSGSEAPGAGIGDLEAGTVALEPGIGDLGSVIGDLGSGIGDLGPGIGDLVSGNGDLESEARPSQPPVPAAWARKRPSIADLASAPPTGEFHELFARLGVPDEVASVAYANGCRIRRVRVPVAREQHSALQGAVLLSRRMIAELRGTDAR